MIDLLMAAVSGVMSAFLLPSIFHHLPPHRLTCAVTAVGLAVVTVCMGVLGLWLAVVVDFVGVGLWVVLFVQAGKR